MYSQSDNISRQGAMLAPIRLTNAGSCPSRQRCFAACLHRFGVLLAVNNLAHRLWPFLPVANAYEKRLAEQLAAEKI